MSLRPVPSFQKHLRTASSVHDHFVARQPVFTSEGALWGYELLFRDNPRDNFAAVTKPEEATAEIIVDGLSLVFPCHKTNLKALINIPKSMLESDMLEHLPAESCVLEILEDVSPTPEVLATLARLKGKGYTLALDDYVGQEKLTPFLPIVDIVKVDFLAVNEAERAQITESLRVFGCKELLAEKVETQADASQARALGYGFLQGYFFQRPEIFGGSKVPATVTSRLHALWLLSNSDSEQRDLMDFFVRSPQLAFRLLKFVNSATFAKDQTITSLKNALNFLGLRRTRHWLASVIMADGQRSDKQQEMATIATARAFFMESLAESMRLPHADEFFMTGLFSLLNALYKIPFEDLLAEIPLSDDVLLALTCRSGPLGPWLKVAEHLEEGRFGRAERLLTGLGIANLQLAAKTYNGALRWARDSIV